MRSPVLWVGRTPEWPSRMAIPLQAWLFTPWLEVSPAPLIPSCLLPAVSLGPQQMGSGALLASACQPWGPVPSPMSSVTLCKPPVLAEP